MITFLLACVSSQTPDTAVVEDIRMSVLDLGDCPASGLATTPEPDGEIVALQGRVDYDDGRTYYRSDDMVYTLDGEIVVRCTEGQSVAATVWVIPL